MATSENQDIAEIEAVGPILALATWPQLTNGLWIHFIDNDNAHNMSHFYCEGGRANIVMQIVFTNTHVCLLSAGCSLRVVAMPPFWLFETI